MGRTERQGISRMSSREIGSPRGRRGVFLWVALLGFAGCTALLHPAAENTVSVRGKISNVAPDATCNVKLLTDRGNLAANMTTTAEFKRQLLVEGGHWKYYVDVTCAGHSGSYRSAIFELTATNKVIDLGTVVLK